MRATFGISRNPIEYPICPTGRRKNVSMEQAVIDLDDFARIFVDQQGVGSEADPYKAIRWREQAIAGVVADPVVATEIDGRQALPPGPAPIGVALRRPVGTCLIMPRCADIALICMDVDI